MYFCATEAAGAEPPPTSIGLGVEDSSLALAVHGVAGAGLDLQGVVDRVEAVGGSLVAGDHTLALRIPVGTEQAVPASAHLVAGSGPRL